VYIPAHFAPAESELAAALGKGGFAHLVTPTADGLISTPLPLLYDVHSNVFLGHVARNNPHWRAAGQGESLAIFARADAYISPGYYPSKAEHGRVVPTWNYEVVHVHGRLVVHDDVEWLRDLVTRLTQTHEATRPQPWQVTDAPGKFVDGQLRAIVGLELLVSRVEGKAKLSQNRPEADQEGVITALSASALPAEREVAAAMKAHQQQ
jgi:transcriptional regulator